MEFTKGDPSRSNWLGGFGQQLKKIHIVDTMPEFHYDAKLKTMYMDVVKPSDDHRLNRSCKTGLLLRENDTIDGPCTLSTGGIDGAQVPPLYKFTNRGPHGCSNLAKCWEDLEKSTPKLLIPEHVSRPSNILNNRDIQGTCPHPKNMKVGDEARDTNPMDPHYILPSFVEPWIPLPKFVRDSLDVGDIEGTRPSPKKKNLGRGNQLSVSDIEGTHPGWKPFHQRKFGREVRNLCLQVEDICGPTEQRVLRPANAEVYADIEGSHPKDLTYKRRDGNPQDLNLRIDDIQGAYAGSGTWEGATRRRKDFAKTHSRSEREQRDAEDSALSFLRARVQDQIKLKGLKPKDVASTFQLLDRQQSGKLDVNEVNRAFKTLRLDVCPSDLSSISKAFVHPTGDGYLDYWKLVKELVPVHPRKAGYYRDVSNNVGRSIDEGEKCPGQSKPCYDPSWVPELVASRVPDSGNQFQPFNSGRPVLVSKYLKQPHSNQQQSSFGIKCATVDNTVAQAVQQGELQSREQQVACHVKHISHEVKEARAMPDHPLSEQQGTSAHMAHDVPREVPVLSVLPECEPQPAQVIKDVHFQEIIPGNAGSTRHRQDCLFSKLEPPQSEAPDKSLGSSEPLFDKLRGLSSQEVKPLPVGGPFWPGFVEVLPEDLAPQVSKASTRNAPLPMGAPFWSGVSVPHCVPRLSLRRDYPVPPLASQVHSDSSLRKAGQREKVSRTWVDCIGDGAAATTFVGEGNQVLSRSGMQGYAFSCPSSAKELRQDQTGSTPQTASTLSSWNPTIALAANGSTRPQTVNSIFRGSPLEYPLLADRDRRLLSGKLRPSTAQSLGCSPMDYPLSQDRDRRLVSGKLRPSTAQSPGSGAPADSPVASFSARPTSASTILGVRMQSRCDGYGHSNNQSKTRNNNNNSGSSRRYREQVREDVDAVRLLI